MPDREISFEPPTNELKRAGVVVGLTDRVYPVSGSEVTFDEVLIKGDLSGELDYNGTRLRVTRVDAMVGLEVGAMGARGPLWKGVECEVLK